jgi:hypothetical protein
MSIVAHELEHVAAPSRVPRFHGGVDSPEERRATSMERVVRRLAATGDHQPPSTGTAGLPVGGLTAFGRAGSAGSTAGAPTTTTTRAGGAAPGSGPPVPASALQHTSARTTIHRAPNGELIRRDFVNGGGDDGANDSDGLSSSTQTTTNSAQSDSSGETPALSPAQLSAIIRAVEDRLLEEIERRGGLGRGAF